MGDPAALADLNRLVHPDVLRRRAALEQEARDRGDRIVVSDIPLLFEAADPSAFDAIVLVDAPETVRRAPAAGRARALGPRTPTGCSRRRRRAGPSARGAPT